MSPRVGEEAFAIIRDAMRDEQVVGLGRVVIARRERIMMQEPLGKGILGTALRYGSEVRGEDAYFDDVPDLQLPQEMKDLAHVIIERKAGTSNLRNSQTATKTRSSSSFAPSRQACRQR